MSSDIYFIYFFVPEVEKRGKMLVELKAHNFDFPDKVLNKVANDVGIWDNIPSELKISYEKIYVPNKSFFKDLFKLLLYHIKIKSITKNKEIFQDSFQQYIDGFRLKKLYEKIDNQDVDGVNKIIGEIQFAVEQGALLWSTYISLSEIENNTQSYPITFSKEDIRERLL